MFDDKDLFSEKYFLGKLDNDVAAGFSVGLAAVYGPRGTNNCSASILEGCSPHYLLGHCEVHRSRYRLPVLTKLASCFQLAAIHDGIDFDRYFGSVGVCLTRKDKAGRCHHDISVVEHVY